MTTERFKTTMTASVMLVVVFTFMAFVSTAIIDVAAHYRAASCAIRSMK